MVQRISLQTVNHKVLSLHSTFATHCPGEVNGCLVGLFLEIIIIIILDSYIL